MIEGVRHDVKALSQRRFVDQPVFQREQAVLDASGSWHLQAKHEGSVPGEDLWNEQANLNLREIVVQNHQFMSG